MSNLIPPATIIAGILVNWSEGQRYAARFAVFVVLMYHLRQKLSPGQDSSVIIADNPFGGASSGHILEIVMAVAKQTKTQLFCVTAHRQTEIMREFNVLYSLVFRRTLSGQERLIPVDETAAAVCRTGIEPAWATSPTPRADLGGHHYGCYLSSCSHRVERGADPT